MLTIHLYRVPVTVFPHAFKEPIPATCSHSNNYMIKKTLFMHQSQQHVLHFIQLVSDKEATSQGSNQVYSSYLPMSY